MCTYRSILLLIFLFIFCVEIVKSTVFVPAYVIQNTKTSDHIPALHKVSEDSFKDSLLVELKKNPVVVIFAERTLSPEDFQKNQDGIMSFPNLSKLRNESKVTYIPYVQNPLHAVKYLGKEVIEKPISSVLKDLSVPKNKILIVDLNDAKDDEHRSNMLNRHDSYISNIYNDIQHQHPNVLAIYTAHHTSWVAPEGVTHHKIRNLLEVSDNPINLRTAPNFTIWTTSISYTNKDSQSINITLQNITDVSTSYINSSTVVNMKADNFYLTARILVSESGYWRLEDVQFGEDDNSKTMYKFKADFTAPNRFSYHCSSAVFQNDNNQVLVFSDLQVENRDIATNETTMRFSDAYDCTGFTSVPIWSGLFVTFIFLLILTFGISMMMDIKTMDRFDDAKGKTIVINAAE